MERTHEPCVPTCLLPANHSAIRLILKFNVQNSTFKVLKVQRSKLKSPHLYLGYFVISRRPHLP